MFNIIDFIKKAKCPVCGKEADVWRKVTVTHNKYYVIMCTSCEYKKIKYDIDDIEEVENNKEVKKLQEIAKNNNWMSNVRDCLKEDIDHIDLTGNIQKDVQELINIFEDRWQETDYFRLRVQSKANNIASKKIIGKDKNMSVEDEILKMYDYAYNLIDENFWEMYHYEHNTYEIAEELIKNKIKGGKDK